MNEDLKEFREEVAQLRIDVQHTHNLLEFVITNQINLMAWLEHTDPKVIASKSFPDLNQIVARNQKYVDEILDRLYRKKNS